MPDAVTTSFLIHTFGIIVVGLGAWVAELSSSASAESGWVTRGLVGLVFKTAIAALWIFQGTVLARKRSPDDDALTVPDLLAAPYGGAADNGIRGLGVAIVLNVLTAYVPPQLKADGKPLRATFAWHDLTAGLVGSSIN